MIYEWAFDYLAVHPAHYVYLEIIPSNANMLLARDMNIGL